MKSCFVLTLFNMQQRSCAKKTKVLTYNHGNKADHNRDS